MKNDIPLVCPICSGDIAINHIRCTECETKFEGDFRVPALMKLSKDEIDFLFLFFRCGGSYKQMQKTIPKSYPTLKRRADRLIARLDELEEE